MTIYDTSPTPWVDDDPGIGVQHTQFDLNGAALLLIAVPSLFFGWSLKNVSGSATAAIDIYDSTGAQGTPVFPIDFAANETNREWFGDRGILFQSGIYLNVTSGEVKGSILFIPMSGRSAG